MDTLFRRMILIPYFWKHTDNWIQFGVFLRDGGQSLWSVGDKESLKSIKQMLKENDMPTLSLSKSNGVLHAEIDANILDLTQFYLWDEVSLGSENDVWRILKIPRSLWSCPVFKNQYCKDTNLPECILSILNSYSV